MYDVDQDDDAWLFTFVQDMICMDTGQTALFIQKMKLVHWRRTLMGGQYG